MTNNPKPITSEKEAVETFRDNVRVGSNGVIVVKGELRVDGGEPIEQWRLPYMSDLEAFISRVWQSAYSQGEQAGKAEAINESLAKVAIDVMALELTKSDDEFMRGHLHGLKRAMYLLKAKYLSGEDGTE